MKKNKQKQPSKALYKGQTLIEFVFVVPALIVIFFSIFEFGYFYRNVGVVQDIAAEACVVAARRVAVDTQTSTVITDLNFNHAVKGVINVVTARRRQMGIVNLNFNYTDLGDGFGIEPYALYQIDSVQTRTIDGVTTPIVTILVDYRNPDTEGVSVQLIFQHRTLLVGAQFPVPGAKTIVIIPRDVPISSSKVQQFVKY